MPNLPKLSNTEAIILQMLADGDELYGLEMVRRSKGMIARGTIYVTLMRMADKNLIKSRELATRPGEQGPGRRVYTIRAHGARVLDAWKLAMGLSNCFLFFAY